MSTSDPSLHDDLTLLKSIERDLDQAVTRAMVWCASSNDARIIRDLLIETRVAAAELIRREERLRG